MGKAYHFRRLPFRLAGSLVISAAFAGASTGFAGEPTPAPRLPRLHRLKPNCWIWPPAERCP